jgi:hypothetical protein
VGVVAAALAGSTIGFAADSGTVTVSAGTPRDAKLLYTLDEGVVVPPHLGDLRHTTAIAGDGRIATLARPGWTPVPGQIGSVERGGDLFLVDARQSTAPVRLDLYVTNLAALSASYSTLLLPIGVWRHTPSGWRAARAEPTYLATPSGTLSLDLEPGHVYDVSIEAGGTWAAPAGAGGPWGPEFYATAR